MCEPGARSSVRSSSGISHQKPLRHSGGSSVSTLPAPPNARLKETSLCQYMSRLLQTQVASNRPQKKVGREKQKETRHAEKEELDG
eukprot:1546575-Prorocentrum_lima.AAC.1